MSKKVLVIAGSPRKEGNSEILCDHFAKGAKEAGNHVEKIVVSDKKIGYCIACDGCKRNSGKCVINDDMPEVLQKMIDADVIVMSTPVYFYSIDGQMKVLIDRAYARYTEIRNKDFYFIMTAAVGEKQALDRTLECFRGFADCLRGANEKGVIYGTNAWGKGDVQGTYAMDQAYEFGKNV